MTGTQQGRKAGARTEGWRGAERRRLLALRRALPERERARAARAVTDLLDRWLARGAASAAALVLGAYQPIRAELDLRDWLEGARALGLRVALPVVEGPSRPLRYRLWTPGTALVAGAWGIPEPSPEERTVVPDVLLAPPLGFDVARYRLGYGGGFFDRTLAALRAQGAETLAIGVAHSSARIESVRPEPHDLPLDAILTERGWLGADGGWEPSPPPPVPGAAPGIAPDGAVE